MDVQGSPPAGGTLDAPFLTISAALRNPALYWADEVVVAPGTYVEDITRSTTKEITLRSSDGPGRTLLGLPVDHLPYAARAVLEGFTITGPGRVSLHGHGVSRRCVMYGYANEAVAGWGLYTLVGNGVGAKGMGHGPELNIRSSIVRLNGVDVQTPGGLAWVDYSLAGASCSGCGGEGNLHGDPAFWDLAGGDLCLRPGSPCIDAAGAAARVVEFTRPPAGAGPGSITAGSTWSFQFWYRDPGGPLGSGFNLSDALRVGFLP